MIYYSQLLLNPASRQVWKEVSNPYQLHRTLLRAFGSSREAGGVLHRLDVGNQQVSVLVQSQVAPDWSSLTEAGQGRYLQKEPDVKAIALVDPLQGTFHFRLRANPTVKKKREGKKHSNRVPLQHEEQQLAWLQERAAAHGFAIRHVQVSQDQEQRDRVGSGEASNLLTLYTVQFDGVLTVTDPARFRQALLNGIGPAKAFGCGLLSLRRL